VRLNRALLANILQIIIGVAFLAALEYPFYKTLLLGHNDFSTFYAGAKLAHTPALYNHEIMRREVRALWPDSGDSEVYLRAPFYALLLKPLAWLPYRAALGTFLCLTMGSFLWFVIRFAKECAYLPMLAAFSVPMYLNINGGADVPLLLPAIGGFVLLTRRGRDFAAGLVLALCAIKFHLFVFVPLLLLLEKRWRILAGLCAGGVALAIAGGITLIVPWVKLMFSPTITGIPVWKLSPAPNIHGLVTVLGAGSAVEYLLMALVAGAFLWLCFRVDNFELLLGVSLVCGLLVSFHSFTYDDLLLMPVLVLVSPVRILREITGLALTPLAFLATFAGGLYSTIIPLLLLALLGAAAWRAGYRVLSWCSELT
jgi:Glycosyltransferase family 87